MDLVQWCQSNADVVLDRRWPAMLEVVRTGMLKARQNEFVNGGATALRLRLALSRAAVPLGYQAAVFGLALGRWVSAEIDVAASQGDSRLARCCVSAALVGPGSTQE